MARKVFFVWQSELPQVRRFVGKCLDDAVVAVNVNLTPDHQYVVDLASRNAPGSVPLDANIVEKVRECALVVGDITPIALGPTPSDPGRLPKLLPNPNVMFEVGLGAAFRGWSSVALLFDKAQTPDESRLPFDVRNNVLAGFDLSDARGLTRALTEFLRRHVPAAPDTETDWRTWVTAQSPNAETLFFASGITGKRFESQRLQNAAFAGKPTVLFHLGQIGPENQEWRPAKFGLVAKGTEHTSYLHDNGAFAHVEPYLEGPGKINAGVRAQRFAALLLWSLLVRRELDEQDPGVVATSAHFGALHGRREDYGNALWARQGHEISADAATVDATFSAHQLATDLPGQTHAALQPLWRLLSVRGVNAEITAAAVAQFVGILAPRA